MPSGNFEKFLVRRARVRDDPGRSPQIELEPERSFDRPLSGQSVYEQTSGVLRHILATMTQRGLKHHSLLELIASFPPSHPGNRARRQQGPRGPQRSEGRPSLADWLNLCTVSSTEQETARAPTRELEGTSHRSVCISSGTSGRCSCRNFGTGIITLMLPSGSVHRDVLRLRSSLPEGVAAPNCQLLRQRHFTVGKDVAASLQPCSRLLRL